MLWKKSWEPEAVLAMIGGVLTSFVVGMMLALVLHQAGVRGFRSDIGIGNVLLATLSFHGAVIVLGAALLKTQNLDWREVLIGANWMRSLWLAPLALLLATPGILGLKMLSENFMEKLHWPVEDQMAVDMILSAKPWVCVYLVLFTVVVAPAAEEFFFRGVLFSSARRLGWTKAGWFGVSFLFALVHANAPTFLSLFVLALLLTWLYAKTESLLAPILAHSLFNLANLVLLLLQEKFPSASP